MSSNLINVLASCASLSPSDKSKLISAIEADIAEGNLHASGNQTHKSSESKPSTLYGKMAALGAMNDGDRRFVQSMHAAAQRFGLQVNDDGRIEGGPDAISAAMVKRPYLQANTPEQRIAWKSKFRRAGMI
jgi:hypothetical protein